VLQASIAKALDGFRVLDFTQMMAGPYCTRWLADLGAEVIKIESPEGDTMRRGFPQRNGASTYYGSLNSGKLSVVLDLKQPLSIQAVRELVKSCDVVVENFRPGVMTRLGIGYEALSKINPKLVFCSISGYGQTGPSASRPAFAPMMHAASGYELAHMSFQDGVDQPANCGLYVADVAAASYATIAIQAALLQRSRTGQGQHLDVTLMESILCVMVYEMQEVQFPTGQRKPTYEPLKAADGFVIVVANTNRNFENLCEAIGRQDWLTDPRMNTSPQRKAHWAEYNSALRDWARSRTASQCEQILTAAGVPCSAYRTVKDVMDDPHFAQRHTFTSVRDRAGAFLVQNLPFKMSGANCEPGARVSDLGEDTRSVLSRLTNLDAQTIAQIG
jgi:CoA:oxalate CoA-transferase